MLTFFEYLRQRSFESVLSGAQEALQLLEQRKRHDPPGGTETPTSEFKTPALEKLVGEIHADGGGQEKLPAPRRRGRPRKKEGSGQ